MGVVENGAGWGGLVVEKKGVGGGWADSGNVGVWDPPTPRFQRKRGAGAVDRTGVVENGAGWGGLVVEKEVVVVDGQMAAARGPETPRPLVFTGNEVRGV
jgi:hypothetical protein